MKERSSKLVYSGIGALIVTGIVLVVNFILGYVPMRLDTSEGKIYSLTEGSKGVLKKLDDNLIVKIVFSRDLPPPYNLNKNYVEDILAEYRRASGGRIKLEYVDPAASDKLKNDLMVSGVFPVRLDVREKDRREVKECFMGILFLYQDRHEAIPFVQNPQGLEYEITQRIKRLIDPVKPKIGIVINGGALDFSGEQLKTVGEFANQLYDVQKVDLSTAVPTGFKALWLIGPEQKLEAPVLTNLKQWVENGGTLGLLVDRYRVRLEQFQPVSMENGTAELLQSWGVEFKQGLVYDPLADRIQVRSQQGMMQMINLVDYPYMPLSTDLNRENPAIRDLDAVSLPFVSPLIVSTASSLGFSYTPLMRSSPHSWLNSFPYQVSPIERHGKPEGALDGPFNLGLVIETKPGRVIVFGCSRFVRTDYPLRPTNYAAFINLLDWSAQDESLLAIRSKGSTQRPLMTLNDAARTLIKLLLVMFLPVFVVLTGLIVWIRQRRRRSRLVAAYQES